METYLVCAPDVKGGKRYSSVEPPNVLNWTPSEGDIVACTDQGVSYGNVNVVPHADLKVLGGQDVDMWDTTDDIRRMKAFLTTVRYSPLVIKSRNISGGKVWVAHTPDSVVKIDRRNFVRGNYRIGDRVMMLFDNANVRVGSLGTGFRLALIPSTLDEFVEMFGPNAGGGDRAVMDGNVQGRVQFMTDIMSQFPGTSEISCTETDNDDKKVWCETMWNILHSFIVMRCQVGVVQQFASVADRGVSGMDAAPISVLIRRGW